MIEGEEDHIKGFILHKLIVLGCFSRGRKHHKHIPVKDLQKGYPLKFRGKFKKTIKKLRNHGSIFLFPARTGRGSEEHVCLELSKRDECRSLVNAYRKSVGLESLNEQFS